MHFVLPGVIGPGGRRPRRLQSKESEVLRTRVARVMAGAVIAMAAVLAPVMTASPANASGAHVGYVGWEARCVDQLTARHYFLCLYYDHRMTTGAYWGTPGNDSDLYDNHFLSGTGTGAGQVVKNNATAMSCPYATECFSYYNHGYAGSYDYEWNAEVGQLFYTWNNDASVVVIACASC
jgi:hypothetical protein